MTPKKILIFAGIGVIALLIAGAAFLLVRGFAEFSKAEARLRRAKKALEGHYAQKPFPSESNVERERKNVEVVISWKDGLLGSLRAGQEDVAQKTPSMFLTHFTETRNRLLTKARESGTALGGQDFAFGFDRYKGGALPVPADVDRLTRQLGVIDAVCEVLFSEKIPQLVSVQRDLFEESAPGDSGGGEGGGGGRFRRGGMAEESAAEPAAATSARDTGLLKEGALFSKLHFAVTFKARERSVTPVLNRLGSARLFVVVTSVSFLKSKDDVTPVANKEGALVAAAADASLGDLAPATTNVAAAVPSGPPRRSQRLVSGGELEEPMTVTVEFDVYRFR